MVAEMTVVVMVLVVVGDLGIDCGQKPTPCHWSICAQLARRTADQAFSFLSSCDGELFCQRFLNTQ